MSTQTQSEYVNKIKEILTSYSTSNEKAYKLIYQWTATGKLKQRTLVELLEYIEESK